MAIYNLGRIDGLSAYEVWLENGNEGTEEEFLASLKGEKGDKGDKGDTGEQGPKGDTGSEGPQGPAGKDGANGKDGADGSDGYSPTATVEQTDTGAIITITDKNGTTTANVLNGKDGEGGGSITLDTAMSDTSENGVQNKVIKAYVDGLVGNIESLLAEV